MDCNRVEELLSDYCEKNLSTELNDEVKSHINDCKSCGDLYESLNYIISDGINLSEDVPFYLKNRLLYIPELVQSERETPKENNLFKFFAASIAVLALLFNIIYFTNVFPNGNYFLHRTIAKVERFTIDTKEFLFSNTNIENNIFFNIFEGGILVRKKIFDNSEIIKESLE